MLSSLFRCCARAPVCKTSSSKIINFFLSSVFASVSEKKKKTRLPFKRWAPRSPPMPRTPRATPPGTNMSCYRARGETPPLLLLLLLLLRQPLLLRPAPAPRGAARGAGRVPPAGPAGTPASGAALRPSSRLRLLLLLHALSEEAAAPRARAPGAGPGAATPRRTKMTEFGFCSRRFRQTPRRRRRRPRRRQTRPDSLRLRYPAAPPAGLPRQQATEEERESARPPRPSWRVRPESSKGKKEQGFCGGARGEEEEEAAAAAAPLAARAPGAAAAAASASRPKAAVRRKSKVENARRLLLLLLLLLPRE